MPGIIKAVAKGSSDVCLSDQRRTGINGYSLIEIECCSRCTGDRNRVSAAFTDGYPGEAAAAAFADNFGVRAYCKYNSAISHRNSRASGKFPVPGNLEAPVKKPGHRRTGSPVIFTTTSFAVFRGVPPMLNAPLIVALPEAFNIALFIDVALMVSVAPELTVRMLHNPVAPDNVG